MYNIQQIKSLINCTDYCSMFGITLNNNRGPSPFHAGSNPTSFICYEDSFYSFSDELGGDVIDLCAYHHHNGDRGKAIQELAAITHAHADHDTTAWRDYMQDLGNKLFHYHAKLTDDDRKYLHDRGISDDTINAIRIGRSEEGRLTIPYWKNGNIVYYVSRAMPGCRYPESKYRKQKIDDYNEHCPWGLDTVSRQSDYLIIAEGAFDALSAYQQGYPVLSAITGHFSSRQLPSVLAIAKQFPYTVLTYDDDSQTSDSGAKFTIKMAKILFQNHIPFLIAPMPEGYHDLSEYHADGGMIKNLIRTAQPGIAYLCKSFHDYADLRKFVLSIARNTPTDELAYYLTKTDFEPSVIKELIRIAKSVPAEQHIANEILREHELIYVPEDAFYEWDGISWNRMDDLQIQDYAIKQLGSQFATAQRSQQITKLLKALVRRQVEFNSLPVVTFNNGTLELETGVFRSHSQHDYVSRILSYDYEPNAQCPEWEQFIQSVTAEDSRKQELLQQIAGYVLFPNCPHQKIFAFVGNGSNGKSVYLETLEQVFTKPNCTYVDPMKMDNEFWLIHLKDSWLNFATEIGSDFSKSENMLKMLSDGSTIQACYKGQNHITFRSRAKLVFACNEMPKAHTVAGMDRRMVFIQFPMRYCEYPDPSNPFEAPINENLKAELFKELPGIFNWCYEGYNNLHRYKHFTETDEQATLLADFRKSSNPIESFVEDYSDYFNGEILCSTVYAWYKSWCEENGHKVMASTTFGRAFKQQLGHSPCERIRKRFNGSPQWFYNFNEPVYPYWNPPTTSVPNNDDIEPLC